MFINIDNSDYIWGEDDYENNLINSENSCEILSNEFLGLNLILPTVSS